MGGGVRRRPRAGPIRRPDAGRGGPGERVCERAPPSPCPPSAGRVAERLRCEDGTAGVHAQPAARPLPLPGAGLSVLLRLEAAPPPLGGLQ